MTPPSPWTVSTTTAAIGASAAAVSSDRTSPATARSSSCPGSSKGSGTVCGSGTPAPARLAGLAVMVVRDAHLLRTEALQYVYGL
ncbi:hypothetical protein GCM10010145_49150 [Streptomyces ruber]|uniref:Uncharacterized protein n=2 Tax=Streptomyces TaxID=1883 RepID=A0A918BJH1_9ACTN|nr:hypothetical protein GCM10010145_49150 [Streptomyces ruber]